MPTQGIEPRYRGQALDCSTLVEGMKALHTNWMQSTMTEACSGLGKNLSLNHFW
jgi:hypothetical protein